MSDGETVLPHSDFDSWQGERVLVTGGAGFLGSNLCRRLMKVGADVHATSRHSRISEQGGTRWWQSDLTSLEDVRSILTQVKPAVIYHLAGAVGANPDLRLVVPTFESLLMSTIHLLIGATEAGCRRVILSGSFTEPKSGDLLSTPSSPYAAAKWASNAYGKMFHALYRTPAVVVTPFMVFGPCQAQSKLIPSVILSLLKREVPRLASGLRAADWIYVGDVVQGFLDAAVVPGIEGATLDLGTGTICTIREVVDKIVELMDSPVKPVFGAIPDRPGEPIRVADTLEARRRLGWSAKTSLDEGLRQTIQWYAEQVSAGRF
ncbi:MAG: NAD-dependent dehydratase [Nitrospira sp. WS238]|nr:NAD-dependent dehydratase [Nitrospira sp. WS238]